MENDKDIRLLPYFWWLQLFWLYRAAQKWGHIFKTPRCVCFLVTLLEPIKHIIA